MYLPDQNNLHFINLFVCFTYLFNIICPYLSFNCMLLNICDKFHYSFEAKYVEYAIQMWTILSSHVSYIGVIYPLIYYFIRISTTSKLFTWYT